MSGRADTGDPRAGGSMGMAQELLMGARFAVSGGREGWIRVVLTAFGVGLGVTLLLFTAAVPAATSARDGRTTARSDESAATLPGPSDRSVLVGRADTTYRGADVRGRLLHPEGAQAPVPPGLNGLPAAGDMVVSPALAALLASPDGALLKERLPYRVTGTVAEAGLVSPQDLAYYAGSDSLVPGAASVVRIDHFGGTAQSREWDPVLLLLVLIVIVVLLMPVAVLIAAAVRFGGERRDRRLAALRLVGADAAATRRIAAGEALAGSLLGVLAGFVLFFGLRQFATDPPLFDMSAYPPDLTPNPLLTLVVALAVPIAAVVVTLLAMRGVLVEPLGVVRAAKAPRRRLWWRLLLPLLGLALLFPLTGQREGEADFDRTTVGAGVVLLLVGITALLPWVVDAVVKRLGAGPVSWQLAVRRLQLNSAVATRPVNGIAVAVAGAIALQTLFTGVSGAYTESTGADTGRAQFSMNFGGGISTARTAAHTRAIRAAEGVTKATALSLGEVGARARTPESTAPLTVGDCAALREIARLERCSDGDAFVLRTADRGLVGPGRKVFTNPVYDESEPLQGAAWTIPAGTPTVASRKDPQGNSTDGVLATPGALPAGALKAVSYTVFVSVDPAAPDGADHLRNAVAAIDPLITVFTLQDVRVDDGFASVRRGLAVGALAVMLLIGAGLLISQLEQLRERKRLLAALVAFGTRRGTLGASVLWQTAVPVVLGLALACAGGLVLGAVLLKVVSAPVSFDWAAIGAMAGGGLGVVALVTLLSLPPLWRLMRPEGLRAE